jgi:hypothetical protein
MKAMTVIMKVMIILAVCDWWGVIILCRCQNVTNDNKTKRDTIINKVKKNETRCKILHAEIASKIR